MTGSLHLHPDRRYTREPDPYLRAVARNAARGLTVCDCPCHWWPGVRAPVPCCPNRGWRWAGDGFVPWNDDNGIGETGPDRKEPR